MLALIGFNEMNSFEKKRILSNFSNRLYYFKYINLFNYCYSETYLSNNKEFDYLKETYIASIYSILKINFKKVFIRNIDKKEKLFSGAPNEYEFLNFKYKLIEALEIEFKDF